jgi:hypothetical protein
MSPGFNDAAGPGGYTSFERRRRNANAILRETPGGGS